MEVSRGGMGGEREAVIYNGSLSTLHICPTLVEITLPLPPADSVGQLDHMVAEDESISFVSFFHGINR